MRVVTLEKGTLILHTPQAEELFDQLVEDGIFWEFLSTLFDERSRGLSAGELSRVREKVSDVEAKVDQLINLLNSGARVELSTPAPSLRVGDAGGLEKSVEVKKATVDLSSTPTNTKSMLSKMKRMGGKK